MCLIGLICRWSTTSVDENVQEDSYPNPSWSLALCMETLAKLPAEWISLDFVLLVRTCLERWSWAEGVIGGLISLSKLKHAFVSDACLSANCSLAA